jgi:hypothetical protein
MKEKQNHYNKKIFSHTKIPTIICANAQHLANKIEYINIKIIKKL